MKLAALIGCKSVVAVHASLPVRLSNHVTVLQDCYKSGKSQGKCTPVREDLEMSGKLPISENFRDI